MLSVLQSCVLLHHKLPEVFYLFFRWLIASATVLLHVPWEFD